MPVSKLIADRVSQYIEACKQWMSAAATARAEEIRRIREQRFALYDALKSLAFCMLTI